MVLLHVTVCLLGEELVCWISFFNHGFQDCSFLDTGDDSFNCCCENDDFVLRFEILPVQRSALVVDLGEDPTTGHGVAQIYGFFEYEFHVRGQHTNLTSNFRKHTSDE